MSWVTRTSVVPRSLMAAEQQLDDVASGRLVEIAGRFVGDDDGGIGRERTRERDALLLAAGKLGRIMMQARARPTAASSRSARASASARAGEFERHRDVFQRRHGRDQMERLKDDADVAGRENARADLRRAGAIPRRRPRPSRSPAAPARSSPSAASICRSRKARAGRPPRRGLYCRSMSRRIWTRAAPRPSDRLTPPSTMASPAKGCPEMSFMRSTSPLLQTVSRAWSVAAHMGGGARSAKSPRFVAWRSLPQQGCMARARAQRRSISSRSAIR